MVEYKDNLSTCSSSPPWDRIFPLSHCHFIRTHAPFFSPILSLNLYFTMAYMSHAWFCSLAFMASGAAAQQPLWGQCGGEGYKGPTACVQGTYCSAASNWYAQCVSGVPAESIAPNEAVANAAVGPSTVATVATTSVPEAGPTTTSKEEPASAPTGGSDQAKYAGVNIAGFDFCVTEEGACVGTANDSFDGIAQMTHFVNDDKLNTFRLPVAWQYLTSTAGGMLDSNNLANYDNLMQGCLDTGALCIIDVHNYARWEGGVIGQGGPSNGDFANLWFQLATKYAGKKNVGFGIMNEPHDIIDIYAWGETVQAAVTAIRDAGATSQYVFLPGDGHASAGAFVSSNSGDALSKVKNLDGSTDNLIFEVHMYLDSSGKTPDCQFNGIDDMLAPLAEWLRTNKRMAFMGEIGGGQNSPSCKTHVCAALDYLNKNNDVYFGYTGWSAGAFEHNYILSLRPTRNQDTPLMEACFSRANS